MRSLRSLRRLPGARARSTSASSPAPSAAIADVLQAGPSVDVDEPKCRHELERASLDAAINQLLPYESGRRYIVPDVQLTSHAELGADAARHERVISLLPPQVRTQLLSAGSLGRQLWASASAEGSVPDLKALPKEAGPGVVLVTDGPEQVLADSLADALAWELGASSLVCRDAGRAAPGPFNLDMTPDIRDPLNREFAERQRADAADVLRSVFLPADGSSSSGSPKTALGGGAVARPPLPPSPVVLLLTQELVVLQHQRVPRSNARPGQESAPAWLQLAHELVSKTILTVLLLDAKQLDQKPLQKRRADAPPRPRPFTLSAPSLAGLSLANQVSLRSAAWERHTSGARLEWGRLVAAAEERQTADVERVVFLANLRRLRLQAERLLGRDGAAQLDALADAPGRDAWPASLHKHAINDAEAAELLGLLIHHADADAPAAAAAAHAGEAGAAEAAATAVAEQAPRAAPQWSRPLTASALQRAAVELPTQWPERTVSADGAAAVLASIAPEVRKCVVAPGQLGTSFGDVGSLSWVKDALHETVLLPLRRPELFKRGNLAKPCTGVLLYGPPGTGKTLICRALAAESDAHFISLTRAVVASKWYGESEKLIRNVFAAAEELAPSVIVLDEIDSLLSARSDSPSGHHDASLVNEFLAAWDGLTTGAKRTLVVGTTNRPDRLDEAVLRRMPRRLMIDMPDEEQREQILGKLLAGEALAADVSLGALARDCDGFSGSDLKNLCLKAAYAPVHDLLAREEASAADGGRATRLGGDALRAVEMRDFAAARRKMRVSVAKSSASRDAMKAWHEKFGEGSTPSGGDGIGF